MFKKCLCIGWWAWAAAVHAGDSGVTPTEIRLGASQVLSGPLGPQTLQYGEGARLLFDAINASGGIHGRKIGFVSLDDGFDPARALQNTRQLADIRQEVQMLRNRLQGLDHELASADVRSPVDGVVADVSIFTEGGVVTPGFKLMDILPTGEPLLIEAEVPVDAIDSVRPGLAVEVMVAAFNQNTTPRIPAEVIHVSPDRIVDDRSGQVFYRMRARTTTEGDHLIRRLNVKPGMPVEIYVRTGERTLLNYLFRPLRDSLRMSMTEE